jgi:anti-anti-sigma regulatory factor
VAADFKIFVNKKNDHLHLKLIGEFDGSSAFELINLLKEHCLRSGEIVIHTEDLSSIHPFGRQVFKKESNILNKKSAKLIFTGEHAVKLTPRWCGTRP